MTRRKRLLMKKSVAGTLAIFVMLAQVVTGFSASSFAAGTIPGSLTFQNTSLTRPEGDVEPAISIDADGTMAITGLQRLAPREVPTIFGMHYWSGPFGSTPAFRGLLDADLQRAGKTVIGSGDGDVDLGSTGTLHATSLIFLINSPFNNNSVGVSAITCTDSNASDCTSQIIDAAGADRQWITSDGIHVYIAYHDAGFSAQIHVQRSDDDGYTWSRAGNPIVGQGRTTGNAIFKNIAGPIVADPLSHNVYTIYASASEAGLERTSIDINNILVSRSTDGGNSWTANLVYHAPLFTSLNDFPSLAVDPTNGRLYATWADSQSIFFSSSSDQGNHWSPAVKVNIAPANTCVLPWIAAYNGTVDVVYYATTASSKDDEAAVWNVYLAQTTNGGLTFAQSKVSNNPNHVGVVCTGGACPLSERALWDLFEVAIDPQNGRAAVIYTDTNTGDPKAQVVLATQN